jgi:hypothetical protein
MLVQLAAALLREIGRELLTETVQAAGEQVELTASPIFCSYCAEPADTVHCSRAVAAATHWLDRVALKNDRNCSPRLQMGYQMSILAAVKDMSMG